MPTTPKGFDQVANTDAFAAPADINRAQLFVEDLIGETVTTASALPTSGNWIGRTIWVQDQRLMFTNLDGHTSWGRPTTEAQIVPSSVVGCTVDALGNISFSAVSSFSLNGVFSNKYDFYKLLITIRSASANSVLEGRMRLSNSDAAGAGDYSNSILQFDSSAGGSQTGAVSFFQFNNVNSAGGARLEIGFSDPGTAFPTLFTSEWSHRETAAVVATGLNSGAHGLSTAYDGISLISSTGTITGVAQLVGLSKGI